MEITLLHRAAVFCQSATTYH